MNQETKQLLIIAVTIFLLLPGVVVACSEDDKTVQTTGSYDSARIVCYEGYSYLHELGPTPRTLTGKKDDVNC